MMMEGGYRELWYGRWKILKEILQNKGLIGNFRVLGDFFGIKLL